jgi:hypothetical protein
MRLTSLSVHFGRMSVGFVRFVGLFVLHVCVCGVEGVIVSMEGV